MCRVWRKKAECGAKRSRWRRFLGCGADSGGIVVCAFGAGCLEWVEIASLVFGDGYHRVMGSLLHDSPIGSVLWTGSAFVVARVRTWECDGGSQRVQGDAAESTLALTASW